MTSLADLLSRRVGPLETSFALSSVIDPETNQPALLRFRVPTSVDVANIIDERSTPLAMSATIIARFIIEPRLDAVVIQEKCATTPGAYVDLETVAARVFSPDEMIAITNHLLEVANITAPIAEVEETAKN